MSSEDQQLAVACVSFVIISKLIKNKKKRRQECKKQTRKWIPHTFLRRDVTEVIGTFLLDDLLADEQSEQFQNFYNMSKEDFDFILNGIRSTISKKDTRCRKACPPELRFAITLRYLATGVSFSSLQHTFGISKQSISRIIPEVCEAIIQLLKNNIKTPSTPAEWQTIAEKFEEIWNFPKCLGVLYAKLILLQASVTSMSQFSSRFPFNIVLMAVVDADYNFTLVDIDCQESTSDGVLFKNCELYEKIVKNQLNLPEKSALPGRNREVPYVFLGSSPFPLEENIMTPFPGSHPRESSKGVFNYRLDRARLVVENAFGVMCNVFRVLRRPMQLEKEKAKNIVMCVVCLHNFLRSSKTSRNIYTPPNTFDAEVDGGIIPGNWRCDAENSFSFLDLRNESNRTSPTAEEVREEFADYFCTYGQVPLPNKYE